MDGWTPDKVKDYINKMAPIPGCHWNCERSANNVRLICSCYGTHHSNAKNQTTTHVGCHASISFNFHGPNRTGGIEFIPEDDDWTGFTWHLGKVNLQHTNHPNISFAPPTTKSLSPAMENLAAQAQIAGLTATQAANLISKYLGTIVSTRTVANAKRAFDERESKALIDDIANELADNPFFDFSNSHNSQSLNLLRQFAHACINNPDFKCIIQFGAPVRKSTASLPISRLWHLLASLSTHLLSL